MSNYHGENTMNFCYVYIPTIEFYDGLYQKYYRHKYQRYFARQYDNIAVKKFYISRRWKQNI